MPARPPPTITTGRFDILDRKNGRIPANSNPRAKSASVDRPITREIFGYPEGVDIADFGGQPH